MQGLRKIPAHPRPRRAINDHLKPMTNPNQALPSPRPASDDAHTALMLPNSGRDRARTPTLAGGLDRFQERLQSTLKEARLALDSAESTGECFVFIRTGD